MPDIHKRLMILHCILSVADWHCDRNAEWLRGADSRRHRESTCRSDI